MLSTSHALVDNKTIVYVLNEKKINDSILEAMDEIWIIVSMLTCLSPCLPQPKMCLHKNECEHQPRSVLVIIPRHCKREVYRRWKRYSAYHFGRSDMKFETLVSAAERAVYTRYADYHPKGKKKRMLYIYCSTHLRASPFHGGFLPSTIHDVPEFSVE